MAKVKGYNPPNTELTYEDASGVQHFFGELVQMILGDPFPSLAVDPEDEEGEGE